MLDTKAHMSYLRTYASHADHPNAPAVCRLARDILSAAAQVSRSGESSAMADEPALSADRSSASPATETIALPDSRATEPRSADADPQMSLL